MNLGLISIKASGPSDAPAGGWGAAWAAATGRDAGAARCAAGSGGSGREDVVFAPVWVEGLQVRVCVCVFEGLQVSVNVCECLCVLCVS